ncbi:MAG: hypothetical protein NC908_04140, partial [Candidatus Omnitrophica bacterium]|nr:hypothetical protein [Candidatus Omnitrophota bacterium]
HPDWFGANNPRQAIENILGTTQYVASEIKKIDSGHPVYTVWADLPTKEQVSKVPSLDGWGINYYDIKRIINGEFFRKAQEIFGNKVFFVHETGVDSFDSATGRQNQTLQAQEAVRIFEAALKYAPSNFKYLSFMSANDEPWKPQVEGCCIARSDGLSDQFNGRYWGFFTQKGEPKRVVDLLFGKIKEMLGKKTIDRVAQVVRSTQPSEREERTTQLASRPEDTQRAAVEQKKEIVTTGLAGERKGIREELDRFKTEINRAKEELRKRSQMQNKGIKNTDEEIKRINESLDKILEEIERVKASLEISEPEEAKRYLEDTRLKATFDLIAGYVNLYNSNPDNALKMRIEQIKNNSKGKNEIRIGIGYNWQNPLGSVLSKEFLPNIYLNILVPSDYYTASEALNLIKGLSAGQLRIAGYLGLGRNILFDLPNYIKGRPHQDESGLLVVPEGVRLKNPFVSKSTFYPQDIYKDGRWQKQGPVKYYDSPLLRLPDQVLPETFGRIPGIGKLFGDYRNTAVWEKTKYPAIVIFGNIEQEFYQKGLRNQDKNKLYLIRREGQDAALYEVDLKASTVKTWLRVPRFTPESKEYCKDFGLWQEDGEVYIIPSLWILEQIRLHHQVYSGKAIAALVNPLTGEILDDIRDPNTGKIQPGLITRLQDMPVTTKVKISYTRNGMVVNPNEETEVDVWTGIQLGTWSNGEPVYPVLIYSVDSAKLNYWLWRKVPVSERVDFVGDFIDLEGNITPIFKNNQHSLKQVKLDSLKEVRLSDNYRITLPKGMPVYSLNGRLGIFVEKPERIPLARLSFNRGVFYLYDEKEIHSLLSAEKNKTTYAVFSDRLYALLEYGANLDDYRLHPDIWAVGISKEGIREYRYPPLGVKPEDLRRILAQDGLGRIPASIQKLLKDTEDIIALLSSAGEEYVTTDFINKLKEAKDRLSASESNLREAQKRYEEDINRQFEERTNSLLLLARGYFSVLRAISEQEAKDNAEFYLKRVLSQMYPEETEYNRALYSIKNSKDPVSTFKQYLNDYLKRQKEYALNLIQQESRNIEWLNYRIKILDKAIEDLTKPAEQVNDPEGFKDHIRPVEIELEAIQEALSHLSEQGKPKKDPEGFEQHTSSVRAELDKLQQAITHLSEQGKPKKDPEGFEQHTSSVRAELDKLQQAITHLSEQGKPKKDPEGFQQHIQPARVELSQLRDAYNRLRRAGTEREIYEGDFIVDERDCIKGLNYWQDELRRINNAIKDVEKKLDWAILNNNIAAIRFYNNYINYLRIKPAYINAVIEDLNKDRAFHLGSRESAESIRARKLRFYEVSIDYLQKTIALLEEGANVVVNDYSEIGKHVLSQDQVNAGLNYWNIEKQALPKQIEDAKKKLEWARLDKNEAAIRFYTNLLNYITTTKTDFINLAIADLEADQKIHQGRPEPSASIKSRKEAFYKGKKDYLQKTIALLEEGANVVVNDYSEIGKHVLSQDQVNAGLNYWN